MVTTAASGPVTRRELIAAAGLGLLAVAVSATGSGTASLWGDEAASVLSAQRSFGSLAMMAQHVDAVHTLYYAALHLWIGLVGTSPVAVRLPSAVAIGIAVAALVLLGRRLRGLRFGILAGVVGAVLPRLTDVGSEARSYAFTAAIAVILTLLAVVQLQAPRPRRRWWVVYSVVLAVGTLLFIWIALIAVSHLVVILLARPGRWRAWLAAFVAAMAAASPVLLFAVLERNQIAYLSTRQSYDVTALFVTPWFENATAALVGWPLVVGGIVLGAREWLRGRRRWHVRSARWSTALIPAMWMLLPSVALIGGSLVVAVYTPRYLAMCAPAVALLIATPLDALLGARGPARGRVVRTAVGVVAAVAMVAAVAPVWASQRTPYAKNNSDWAVISATIASRAAPGDAVAFDDTTRPSRRTRLALRTYPQGFAGLRDVTLKTPYTERPSWYDATYPLAEAIALGRLDGVSRLWLVEYALPSHTDTAGIAAATAAGFHAVATTRTHRSAIIEFVRE